MLREAGSEMTSPQKTANKLKQVRLQEDQQFIPQTERKFVDPKRMAMINSQSMVENQGRKLTIKRLNRANKKDSDAQNLEPLDGS